MTYEEFFNCVIIDEADKAKANYYLDVRGISEHIFVGRLFAKFKSRESDVR